MVQQIADIDITWNRKLFCPLYWHLAPLLRDPKIRFIYVEGGSSAAKTFSILQCLIRDMWEYKYSALVFRRYHVHIRDTVYASAQAARDTLGLKPYFTDIEDVLKFDVHDARLVFKGLDNEENIKGIEKFDIVYNNEFNHFSQAMFDQERKRLRGRPNQKFICDWNPVSEKLWFYTERLDLDEWIDLPLTVKNCPSKYSGLNPENSFKKISRKGNAVWLKVTYLDNFWVVGHPSGKGGFVDQATLDDFDEDRRLRPNFYRIYGLGLRGVMRTGGEFWSKFDDGRHVGPVVFDPNLPLHATLDVNVRPYVTILLWQVDPAKKRIYQVHELLCKEPNNNAPSAARVLVKWLQRADYRDAVLIYGDPSANNSTALDEENSSFFDKFIGELRQFYAVINRILTSAPPVAMSGVFINEIYEFGIDSWSITISDKCRASIDDYNSVKADANGRMIKEKITETSGGTKITWEVNGHISDAKRYFLIELLEKEFKRYRQRRSKLRGVTT